MSPHSQQLPFVTDLKYFVLYFRDRDKIILIGADGPTIDVTRENIARFWRSKYYSQDINGIIVVLLYI